MKLKLRNVISKCIFLLILSLCIISISQAQGLIDRNSTDYISVPAECSTPTDPACIIELPPAQYNKEYIFVIPLLVSNPDATYISADDGWPTAVKNNYQLSYNEDTVKLLVTAWDWPDGRAGYVTFTFNVDKAGEPSPSDYQKYIINLKRDTAKVVLVLDKSGSMTTKVGTSNRTRFDTLRSAVSRLAEQFEHFHQDGDSIGITYFSYNIMDPDPANFDKDFIEITDEASAISSTTIKSDIYNVNAGGMTAMGSGLLNGKEKLLNNKENAPNTKRMVFLVTDGLQNVAPIVCSEGVGLSNTYDYQIDGSGMYIAECTGSITEYLNDYQDNPKDSISYYTLATWQAGLYPEILNAIAEKSKGQALHVVPPDDAGGLEEWFIMHMVNMLHGGSPQIVLNKTEKYISGTKTYTFELNALVKTLLVDLSTKDIDISIKKGEAELLPLAVTSSESSFNMYRFNFPIITDSTISSKGKWTITLTGNSPDPFFLSVIADDHYLNYECDINRKEFMVGETIELNVNLSHLGQPLTSANNKVTAVILKPGNDIGHLLSIYETSLCDTSSEDIPDGVSQKYADLLANNTEFYNAILPNEQNIELTNLGNGEYSGSFSQTDLSGAYNIIYLIEGEIPDLGGFQRSSRISTIVLNDGSNTTTNTFVDEEPPPAPSNLGKSNLTETSLKLKWDPVYDNFGIAKYSIYQNGILINEVNFNKCMLNIYQLAPGTDYSYYVTAQDASGNVSVNSENLIVTTLGEEDVTAPSSPANLIASNIEQTQLNLNWEPSTDNYDVIGYEIYKNSELYANTTDVYAIISNLNPETEYSFYAVAKDASGNISDPSNNIQVLTLEEPDEGQPTPPTNLSVQEIDHTSVYLVWGVATDNKEVVEYDIFENEVYLYSTESTEFYRANLAPESLYSYYTVAKDAAGNVSDKSNVLEVTTLGTPDTEAPTTPLNLSVSNIAQTSLYLSWDESVDNVGVIQYHIFKNNEYMESTTETEFSVTSLIEGSEYTFYVIAEDAAENESDKSNLLTVNTLGEIDQEPPTAPTNLIASDIGQSNVYLSWEASTDNNEVYKYIIYQNGDSLTCTDNTSKSIYSLYANTEYSYYVVAIDLAQNTSEPSNTIEISTLEQITVLGPPSNLTVSNITQTSFKLNWHAATGGNNEIMYGIFVNGTLIDKTTNTKYIVDDLSHSNTYIVHLIARDSNGNISDASKPIKVKTLDRFVLTPKNYFKIIGLRIKPKGKFDYFVGPGFAPVIKFEYKSKRKEQLTHKASIIDHSTERTGYYPEPYLKKIKDNLDGTYDLIIGNIKPKTNPNVKITFRDNTVYEGPIYKIPLWFYIIIVIVIVIILILMILKQTKTKFYKFMWLVLVALLTIWFLHYTGQLFFLYMI